MGAALYRQQRQEQPVPELPDLLHVVGKLRERLVGKHVVAEHVKEPVVLRFAVRGNLSLLLGRALEDVFRKSHFLVFRFEGFDLAVNPMLAGRFRFAEVGKRWRRRWPSPSPSPRPPAPVTRTSSCVISTTRAWARPI
jgi:formamidopyrimidine-DNA glycosylase